MPEVVVRPAADADLTAIASISAATGQEDEWGGQNPAYIRHLRDHGQVAVAELDGTVAGFGATQQLGTGPAAVSMLCDLFVDPAAHGRGCGRAILARLWDDAPRRMTFSSLHPQAVPLYTSFGLDAWWPLLELSGDVRAVQAADGWLTRTVTADKVGQLELEWTGADRSADHRAWAARPGGTALVAGRAGQVLAAGTVMGTAEDYGLVHLAVSPAADDAAAAAAVLTMLARLSPPGRLAHVSLPAPHPAARMLMAAGWRFDAFDLFMASEPGLLDPRRAVPSPGQA
jgi:GNAT superfamily N-acetyltransferase